MKKLNKLFLLAIIVFITCLVGCQNTSNTKKVSFESNGGSTVEAITVESGSTIKLPSAPTYEGYSFVGWYTDIELTKKFDAKSAITEDITLYAKWVKDWDGSTPITDSLKLEEDYEGKDFYEDGIGIATVVQYVDGDTTIFKTLNGHKITVRYEGIDTPESTYTVQPWGFAASNFTKDSLKDATIVLKTDNGKPGKDNLDSTGKRCLAWVWANGRLVNLDLVENALAYSKASGSTLASYFNDAVKAVVTAKARIYGNNNDPTYDYSNNYEEISLKDLVTKYATASSIEKELDKGKKVKVAGTIARTLGTTSAYLQQVSVDPLTGELECYGVYLYGGYALNNKLGLGYSVIVSGTIGYYNGSLQITDVSSSNVKVQSFYDQDKILVNELTDVKTSLDDYKNLGNLVKINTPVTITSTYDAESTTAFSLRATYTDASGKLQNLSIRIDRNALLVDENGDRITSGDYFVGKTFESLIAIVSYYDPTQDNVHNGYVQLMLVRTSDFVLAK